MSTSELMRGIGGAFIAFVLYLIIQNVDSSISEQKALQAAALEAPRLALIAKHELGPGLTRTSAITENASAYGSPVYWVYDSRLTYQMVIESWGTPDEIIEISGSEQEYVYYQPPDGELHVDFEDFNTDIYHASMVRVVLYPAYFKNRNPTWSSSMCERIADGRIALGMTSDMVRSSWGRPEDTSRSVGSWGVHEQWVYRIANYSLYFEDGILTSWSEW